ncbi:MAG: aminoacyl-tRNA hydrolase [Oscillospiraceae bacterium]|nr:aminoacyl-tRNA hydrolase [Oscillospiraceae bacterium]
MLFSRPGKYGYIVAFLGNPGARYAQTRHNAGFITGDAFCRRLGCKIDRAKFHALTGEARVGEQKVLLMKPQTYMNDSGTALREAMSFYKVPLDHVIVVSDDISLPVGKLRVRRSGSAGGHNGLKDIIAKCGGEGFPRVKIGIGQPEHELIDWVLSAFHDEDAVRMKEAADRAAAAVESLILYGVDKTMNDYN